MLKFLNPPVLLTNAPETFASSPHPHDHPASDVWQAPKPGNPSRLTRKLIHDFTKWITYELKTPSVPQPSQPKIQAIPNPSTPKKSQNPEDKGRIFHWFPSKMVESWPHCPTMPGRKGGPWIFWIRPRHQGKAIEAAEINAWKSPMGSQCHWIGLLGKILTGNPWLFTIK